MHFNPRSHEESGLATLLAPLLFRYFNPRSHEESGLLWKNWKEFNGEFQSTLSRGERRKPPQYYDSLLEISIHALTRRAAQQARQGYLGHRHFNPRSHEESGGDVPPPPRRITRFQSTLSRGERPAKYYGADILAKISIHALTRRAAATYSM